ncbi:hypothetical protein GCM10023258_32320 [Terrabacter aeriphilus]|uniref:Uncharacterized protein n=1 Tax=Terrabacter aeriphilus TaxID=515662 RepID=A0ABP9JI34_9MICO
MSDDDSRTAPTRRSGRSSTSGTARSLPAGAARPALPDPQHDRHVSFPDDQPDASPDGALGRPHPAAAALPAEAWAPRTAPSRPRGTSVARPGPPPPPTPVPSSRRRFPGWVAVLLVPPLLLGIAGNQSHDASGDCTGTFTQLEVDGTTTICSVGDGPFAVEGVMVTDVSASTIHAPFLRGRPVVAPVPSGASLLTVEVVMVPPDSGGPGPVAQVETMVDGTSVDSHEAPVPYALDVQLDTPHSELVVVAAVTSGEGRVQCRVYAGSTLVAVNTSTLEARCTVPL